MKAGWKGYIYPLVNYYASGAPQNFHGQIMGRAGSRWLIGEWDENTQEWEDVHVVDFSHNWGKKARKVKRAAQREARYWKLLNLRVGSKLRGPAKPWQPED